MLIECWSDVKWALVYVGTFNHKKGLPKKKKMHWQQKTQVEQQAADKWFQWQVMIQVLIYNIMWNPAEFFMIIQNHLERTINTRFCLNEIL